MHTYIYAYTYTHTVIHVYIHSLENTVMTIPLYHYNDSPTSLRIPNFKDLR